MGNDYENAFRINGHKVASYHYDRYRMQYVFYDEQNRTICEITSYEFKDEDHLEDIFGDPKPRRRKRIKDQL